MNQVVEFFKKLLDTSDFPARWHCGTWTSFHGWLYILSDMAIWSAYFAIPTIIINYLSRRKSIRFHKIYFLFAAFILACGLTHFLDAVMFWYPLYRLNAVVRFITAVASWLTVYHLFRILPTAFALRTPVELEKEVEQRRLAEEELIVKNRQLNEAQEIAKLGHWEWDITAGSLYWSRGMYKIFGLDESQPITYELFLKRVHPEDMEHVQKLVGDVFATNTFPEYYHRIVLATGEARTIHARGDVLLNDAGEVVKMLGTAQDVTEIKKTEQALLLKTHELQEVNGELEKFAYVASHDLQEPLRKLITYTSLLESDYQQVLDERGNMFLEKIATASIRMKKLISDILNLSKFSSEEISFEKILLDDVVKNILNDLEITINETQATLQVEPLPQVEANPAQMHQLFLNIISNGLKFRHDGIPPVLVIKSTTLLGSQLPADYLKRYDHHLQVIGAQKLLEQERFYKITISDNGIGFDSQYATRIFEVFQRLQSKKQYEGTGIGLAICKKIIENHAGYISASSTKGSGSVFTIYLPAQPNRFRVVAQTESATDSQPAVS